MIPKVKAVLKLATAALLSFTIAPLCADEALHVAPVYKIGFTEANQGLPFITGKDMTQGAAADGSLTFSLDLHFGTDTRPVAGVSVLVHYDSEKIEVTGISNIVHADIVSDPLNIVRVNSDPPNINVAGKSVRADTNEALVLGWGNLNAEITALANATLDAPVRIATIAFKWKAGAAGNSNILITEPAFGHPHGHEGFQGTGIFLQGPAQATITAHPETIDATVGATEIRVKCALSRPVSTEVTCKLGGGTAEPDDPILPTNRSITIVIPKDKNSESHTFSISPPESDADAGKALVIALQSVSAANSAEIPHDPEPVRIPLIKPGLDVPKEKIMTKEGGHSTKFKVRLTLPPSGGDVVVAISSTDTGEATVAPASLRFTPENWDKHQEVTVSGVDDDFEDDNEKYKIILVVDSAKTGATRYHGITAYVHGTNMNIDKAEATLKASPAYLSKAGGEQRVVITATLRDSLLFESNTLINLSKADSSTAKEGEDYENFTLPDSIIIPAGKKSASKEFSIRTTADAAGNDKKTIEIAGTFEHSGMRVRGAVLPILEFNLDVDGDGAFTGRDGILVMRHLMGVKKSLLTRGQTGKGADYVIYRIGRIVKGDETLLNVSEEGGKGDADWIDGALIARYMLGLRGDDLVNDLGYIEPEPEEVERNIGRLLQ